MLAWLPEPSPSVAACIRCPRGTSIRSPIASAPARSAIAWARCRRAGASVHLESAAIGFYSADVGGVIEANASCRDDAEAAPLEALTRLLLIGYTERNDRLADRRCRSTQREALRTQLDAKLDGVPMTLDLLVMKRNGCIFDLSYAAPPDRFARGSTDFAQFVDGFADTRSPTGGAASRGGP